MSEAESQPHSELQSQAQADTAQQPYQVLARKYRPQHFDELVGQDALVRTLKNAIKSGRIAHAFMLTGVRGVGKTTTARIIAKALNYTGADGQAGPTTGETGDCDICRAIAADRHPDVIEMDAASRTGVEDIRDIIDGVRYAPTSARYKIYIIDEVHMLSRNAFNALLKTLEEPPPHVIFIFATTEIRKVPVTVLSRCQRFDLRRVDAGILIDHYRRICEQENVSIEDAALAMIARAADGSVRDGLSLLDQAIALGSGTVDEPLVRDMLGLADRSRILDIFAALMEGNCAAALDLMADMYKSGADPAVMMQDLLEITHVMTRMQVVKETGDSDANVAPEEMERAREIARELSVPVLGRAWQIILKGLPEVLNAPNPQAAAEMVLIRLAHASTMPDPAKLVQQLQDSEGGQSGAGTAAPGTSPAAPAQAGTPASSTALQGQHSGGAHSGGQRSGGPVAALSHPEAAPAYPPQEESVTEPQGQNPARPQSLRDIVTLLQNDGRLALASEVIHFVRLVSISQGRIAFALDGQPASKIQSALGAALTEITGERWLATLDNTSMGEETLAGQDRKAREAEMEAIRAHPRVAEVLETFPGAKIVDIKSYTPTDQTH